MTSSASRELNNTTSDLALAVDPFLPLEKRFSLRVGQLRPNHTS